MSASDELVLRRFYMVLFPHVAEEQIPSPCEIILFIARGNSALTMPDKQTDEPFQLPSDLVTAVRSSGISEARLVQIITRAVQQHIPLPRHQQSGTGSYANRTDIRAEPQPTQLVTPEHTRTNLDAGQILYPDQHAFSSGEHYSNGQPLALVQTSSHIGSSMTRD